MQANFPFMDQKKSKSLEKFRKEIEQIDAEIMKLLQKRFKLALKIAKVKQKEKMSVYQKSREMMILKSLEKRAVKLDIPPTFIKKLFSEIFKQSRKIQRNP